MLPFRHPNSEVVPPSPLAPIAIPKIETVPNVRVPFSPWLPSIHPPIHPFLQFTAPPPPPPPSLLSPPDCGINYTVARDRARPFKFRLFPADAEIELGIGLRAPARRGQSRVQTMKESKRHSHWRSNNSARGD